MGKRKAGEQAAPPAPAVAGGEHVKVSLRLDAPGAAAFKALRVQAVREGRTTGRVLADAVALYLKSREAR